ncbi:MAG TPA: hypothetical protein VMD79_13880 [Solirubrobacteraceae bacterium]|nr:hypothetical protein [Solirubrobacteraceae bacterium]
MTDDHTELEHPSGALETYPLMAGIVAVAIPVGLIAWACIEDSTVVLVFAVLSVIAVGAAALTFIFRLAADPAEHADGGDAHGA